LYSPRTPISPVGVYFSPRTRDYFADQFIASYRGILILLIEQHLEFQVVTPRTMEQFQGGTLVLPSVEVLSDAEKSALERYVNSGKTLLITGADSTGLPEAANIVRMPKDPGTEYFALLSKDFDWAQPAEEQGFLGKLNAPSRIRIFAPSSIATSIANVNRTPHVFLANFSGLRAGENPVQTPQNGVRVVVTGTKAQGVFLPFLGEKTSLTGVADQNEVTFTLPTIEKGAVFWLEP
jgi:hypothetical protein